MFSTFKSVKKPKIRMGASRRNLQAQPKILKKLTEHQIYQPNENFPKKSMTRRISPREPENNRTQITQ
jgi:hypothetical protein